MLTFSQTLVHLKQGLLMQRVGWNGKGMFIFLRKNDSIPKEMTMNIKSIPENVKQYLVNTDTQMKFSDHLMMFTADKQLVPWLASQTDILAEDWQTATV